MHAFEKFLTEKGYVPLVFDHRDKKLLVTSPGGYSTMAHLHKYYVKRTKAELDEILTVRFGNVSLFLSEIADRITFGLNEHGHPATLIDPRPEMVPIGGFTNDLIWSLNERDKFMERAFAKYDHELILKALFDRTIELEVAVDEEGRDLHFRPPLPH